MKLIQWLAVGCLLLTGPVVHGLEVAGVKVDDKTTLAGQDLVLNGAGVRTRVIVDVYVGALYVVAKKTNAADLLAQDGPKRFQMTLLRDIAGKTMSDAFAEGIQNNASDAERQAVKARADELTALITAIGEGKKGHMIGLDFVPGSGTQVVFNGQPRGKPIPGDDFYRVLLKIWLGEKPVDSGLKRALIGGA
ncbi:MAG: chalcone isomerase family protein [Burkholderiales bacterium]